jgi:hypothetical protein
MESFIADFQRVVAGFELLVKILASFPMKHLEVEDGPSQIEGFTPVLTEKTLMGIGGAWYATDAGVNKPSPLAEELPNIRRRKILRCD